MKIREALGAAFLVLAVGITFFRRRPVVITEQDPGDENWYLDAEAR